MSQLIADARELANSYVDHLHHLERLERMGDAAIELVVAIRGLAFATKAEFTGFVRDHTVDEHFEFVAGRNGLEQTAADVGLPNAADFVEALGGLAYLTARPQGIAAALAKVDALVDSLSIAPDKLGDPPTPLLDPQGPGVNDLVAAHFGPLHDPRWLTHALTPDPTHLPLGVDEYLTEHYRRQPNGVLCCLGVELIELASVERVFLDDHGAPVGTVVVRSDALMNLESLAAAARRLGLQVLVGEPHSTQRLAALVRSILGCYLIDGLAAGSGATQAVEAAHTVVAAAACDAR